MAITIDQARAAKARASASLKDHVSVVGVGLTKVGPDYAIKFNLAKAPGQIKLPTRFDGVPLVFEVVGSIEPR